MKKIIFIFILFCNVYGNTFHFEKIKNIILNENIGEKIYINNLTDVSTDTSKYISVEFANASIFKYYILIALHEQNISITKYNFSPYGAYSFSVEYKEIELGIKNFFKNFIDEFSIQSKYIENNEIQFNSNNNLIQIILKNRIPSSTIFVGESKIDNTYYVEPVFDKELKLKYFYSYLDNVTEESIMSQDYLKLINKKEIHIDLKENRSIFPSQQPLYSSPNINSKTKMYLIKGDKVEILEEKNNWLYILYKGKKEIKAWIPKDAIKPTE